MRSVRLVLLMCADKILLDDAYEEPDVRVYLDNCCLALQVGINLRLCRVSSSIHAE
jgi:hypothetical protein